MEITSWTHNGAIYCDDCKPDNGCSDDRCDGDSDCCPQPVFSTSDEADTPQHCETCNTFLENSLTRKGMEWLRENLSSKHGNVRFKDEMRCFYGLRTVNAWPALTSQASAECLQEAITQRMRGVYGLYVEKEDYCLGSDRQLIKLSRWWRRTKPNAVENYKLWFHVETDDNLYGNSVTIAHFSAWIFAQPYKKLSDYVREVLRDEFRIEVA